jgi:hypothetical protein
MPTKIFVFVNGGAPGFLNVMSIGDDGQVCANHICSHEGFIPHDMGFTSDWKHDHYNRYYPDGWELEFVPTSQVSARSHEGLESAYAKNQIKAAEMRGPKQ